MDFVARLIKIVNELFPNPTEEYAVEWAGGTLAYVHRYKNGRRRSWLFDEQENPGVEDIRRRIKGRHNVRPAFKS